MLKSLKEAFLKLAVALILGIPIGLVLRDAERRRQVEAMHVALTPLTASEIAWKRLERRRELAYVSPRL